MYISYKAHIQESSERKWRIIHLLEVQVIFLNCFETVQSQVVVSLTKGLLLFFILKYLTIEKKKTYSLSATDILTAKQIDVINTVIFHLVIRSCLVFFICILLSFSNKVTVYKQ